VLCAAAGCSRGGAGHTVSHTKAQHHPDQSTNGPNGKPHYLALRPSHYDPICSALSRSHYDPICGALRRSHYNPIRRPLGRSHRGPISGALCRSQYDTISSALGRSHYDPIRGAHLPPDARALCIPYEVGPLIARCITFWLVLPCTMDDDDDDDTDTDDGGDGNRSPTVVTEDPTASPTSTPTLGPSKTPTIRPTEPPSTVPSGIPSRTPTTLPSKGKLLPRHWPILAVLAQPNSLHVSVKGVHAIPIASGVS
jgi:hypothetical protein